ncbi:GGDEF domain-containing protein [Allosphingosinicella sp.]|uniref:GGDEF domain-containing protein n=1 Tax=Allosphingosinicella sp. TaxID=2823234 RepID=UPI003783922D
MARRNDETAEDSAQAREAREALQRLNDENALLRAALADARAQLGEAEEHGGRDPLTELADARKFRAELERVVSQAARHQIPAALISVDVDDLKAVNEGHGRVAGDAALRHVAKLLKSLIRSSDVAARNGGGAFALLLDHLDADSALDTAERIARCVAAHPLDLGHAQVKLTATVSVATILPGDSVEEVLRRAARNRERVKEF